MSSAIAWMSTLSGKLRAVHPCDLAAQQFVSSSKCIGIGDLMAFAFERIEDEGRKFGTFFLR